MTPYLTILMLRNFATETWRFRSGERVSMPGCIIASPSRPDDPFTDQDYLHCWVRDAALCVVEAARAPLPGPPDLDRLPCVDLFDQYVRFAAATQRSAREAGLLGHACFRVDGTVRPWSVQADGPALRVMAVLDLFSRLSPSGQALARQVVAEDAGYLLGAYRQPTTDLWEENHGFHFFTRAVQQRCFKRLLFEGGAIGVEVDAPALAAAIADLERQLAEHWDGDHYRAAAGCLGRDVDISTIMGAVYGRRPAADPRLLSTAAVVWDSFRHLYPINEADAARGLGPSLGRYPEDVYDGNGGQRPTGGHPWPLCTAVFAEYYYRVARQLDRDGILVVNALTERFFEQIGCTPGRGRYVAGTPEFAEALGRLVDAGDRMLDAVLFHSDHLEMSEQHHRDCGYQMSVRNLTWSYAAFLRAVRARSSL